MRVLLMLVLVGAAFAAVPRSVPKRMPQRIVGGSPTTVEEYPYMSNMQYHLWGIMWTQFCGGSLITSRTVVSAAHCYDGDRASQWRVRLGSSMASSGGTMYEVSQLISHERYSSRTLEYDIAIVRLASAATLNGQTVSVVPIASSSYNVPDGSKVYTIGWGTLNSGGSSPEQLHHVDLDIINQEICFQRYATRPDFPDITNNMVCAGILDVGGKDACQGDSGGPLVYKTVNEHVLYGVVSWGAGCADPFFPGVNARISYFTNWIIAHGSA